MAALNETHDPKLTSWLESANDPGGDFPVQNLPFAVFRRRGGDEPFRGGVAIGDQVLDLAAAHAAGLFAGAAQVAAAACRGSTLNDLLALGAPAWSALRLALLRLLRAGSADAERAAACLVPMGAVEHALPAAIGDYTDFYSSIHHATNVGKQFRPDNPLLPNYRWVPIGYHGRASSIRVSGTDFRRPLGQLKGPDDAAPTLAPCRKLDYELELGIYVGPGNPLGAAIPIEAAEDHVFGLCLLNDWSARDVQAWEYQPLGPFLSKSFATTISPWIVTLEALAPYRVAWERAAEDPQPLPYLDSPANRAGGAFDVQLEVALQTAAMAEAGTPAARLAGSSFRHSYWSVAQLVAHHTVNGCNLQPGDFLGSGTQSGPGPGEVGSMLELSQGGKVPFALPNGEQRSFVEDGDTVVMRGWCARDGAARIGFGAVAATVQPPRDA